MLLFLVFAILVLIVCLTFYINRKLNWAWNLIIVLSALYMGLIWVCGTPINYHVMSMFMWNKNITYDVLYSKVIPNNVIYLLISKHNEEPIYVALPWTKNLQKALKDAKMKADKDQATLTFNMNIFNKMGKKENSKVNAFGEDLLHLRNRVKLPPSDNHPVLLNNDGSTTLN